MAVSSRVGGFTWLLESPGIGLLTGEPGVGKTAALRHLTDALNPHRYRVIYQPETDFGRLDLYRGLALALDIEPPHRRAPLRRALKARITELTEGQHLLPVWLIDQAQNLPPDFFRDLPAHRDFAFDSRDLTTVWLVGRPVLAHTLQRALYAPLATRIQVHVHLEPISERARFEAHITHALQQAVRLDVLSVSDGPIAERREITTWGCAKADLPVPHCWNGLAGKRRMRHGPWNGSAS